MNPRSSQEPSSHGRLERARRGDRSALSSLFFHHVPLLRRWAHGRLPRWARFLGDTADLVQDAVLNTFQRLDRFENRGEHALQGYLRQSIRNRIIDLTHRAEVPLRAGEVTGEEPDQTQAAPDALAITAQDRERFHAALARLKEADQTLIVGRVELGYTHEQLALVSGRATAEAARIALRRALARLADEMNRG